MNTVGRNLIGSFSIVLEKRMNPLEHCNYTAAEVNLDTVSCRVRG